MTDNPDETVPVEHLDICSAQVGPVEDCPVCGETPVEQCDRDAAETWLDQERPIEHVADRLAEHFARHRHRFTDGAADGLWAVLNYVADNTFCGVDADWHFKPDYDPQVVLDALATLPAPQARRAAQSPPPVVSEGMGEANEEVIALLRSEARATFGGNHTFADDDVRAFSAEIIRLRERLSSPSRGCDAGEDYGPGSPWSEGYNSGFAAASREPSRGCDLETVEGLRVRLLAWLGGYRDNLPPEAVTGLQSIADELRNLGKETRQGEGPPLPGHDRLGRGG